MKSKQIFRISLGLIAVAGLGFSQDWYHDRTTFYQGEGWHAHVFARVSEDLNHIYTAGAASEREQTRLAKTKDELVALQSKLDQGVFDNGTTNDVIDSLRKSANDQRLGPQDREVLADDAARIHEFQRNHNRWMKH